MEPTDGEALTALRAAFDTFFAASPADALDRTVAFSSVRGRGSGIGGLIGADPAVAGEVFGRRLEAIARVSLRAADASALENDIVITTDAVLGATRETLRGLGFLSIVLDELGPMSLPEGGGAVCELSFHLLFEHVRRPEEAGDVIDHILLDDTVAVAGASEILP